MPRFRRCRRRPSKPSHPKRPPKTRLKWWRLNQCSPSCRQPIRCPNLFSQISRHQSLSRNPSQNQRRRQISPPMFRWPPIRNWSKPRRLWPPWPWMNNPFRCLLPTNAPNRARLTGLLRRLWMTPPIRLKLPTLRSPRLAIRRNQMRL